MQDEARITLRLPGQLHSAIKASAEKRKRSMNEEIVTALAEYYQMVGGLADRVERIEQRLNQAGIP